ncbi:MAG: dTDP-4-dehydrorhamnose reductase [Kiritimatiellia bacterium]
MRILITGGKGMLGRTLQRVLAAHELCVADLPEVNIADPAALHACASQFRPDVIIHGAAMTTVDACENNPDLAYQVNAAGSAVVARAAAQVRARLIALSTDYVFDGALDRPYHEWDVPSPRTVYGASKRAGEIAIQNLCPDHLIIRIAWLYGAGGPSFLHTMLKLGAVPGEPLKVVNDQTGNPTSTDAVARLIERLLDVPVGGILHGSCEGKATWYDFAKAIFMIQPGRRELVPCTTAEFPRPAPRPVNSCLEKRLLRLLGLPPMPEWRETLDRFFIDNHEI